MFPSRVCYLRQQALHSQVEGVQMRCVWWICCDLKEDGMPTLRWVSTVPCSFRQHPCRPPLGKNCIDTCASTSQQSINVPSFKRKKQSKMIGWSRRYGNRARGVKDKYWCGVTKSHYGHKDCGKFGRSRRAATPPLFFHCSASYLLPLTST